MVVDNKSCTVLISECELRYSIFPCQTSIKVIFIEACFVKFIQKLHFILIATESMKECELFLGLHFVYLLNIQYLTSLPIIIHQYCAASSFFCKSNQPIVDYSLYFNFTKPVMWQSYKFFSNFNSLLSLTHSILSVLSIWK